VKHIPTRVVEFLRDLSNATSYRSHDLGYEDSIDVHWKIDAADLLASLAEGDCVGERYDDMPNNPGADL